VADLADRAEILFDFLFNCCLRYRRKEFAAMLYHPLSDAIGKEAIMADFHEAGGEYVHQEAANELHRLQRHLLGAVPAAIKQSKIKTEKTIGTEGIKKSV
jgi:hypothetical protein